MNIELLRQYCLSLPGTVEEIKWGADLCFTIGAKMYCVTALEGPFKVSFKCSDHDFELLTEKEGIVPAPYLARNKWVMVTEAGALSSLQWKENVEKSYRLISLKLPAKLKKELKMEE